MTILVYVLNNNGKPLMPTNRHGKVRHLLKKGLAKVIRKEPFTIKLLYNSTNFTQDLTLGVDTGSGTFATSVSTDSGEIVYLSEVQVRDDISTTMKKRSDYRHNRRWRKCRRRKCRFNNRKNSKRKDRFSPTIISKIHSHIKEIEFIKSILPIKTLIFETGKFDTHLMKNPTMNRHWGYQQGPNYGFENTKAMVRHRDGYKCRYCKGKSKDNQLEVHHIVFRSEGGSDDEKNLITLCHTCHTNLHQGKITITKRGQGRGALNFATQMNSIRVQLLRHYPEAIETFGYVTSANRLQYNLPKEHYIDASLIASNGQNPTFLVNMVYHKKSISKGDYRQTDTTNGVIHKYNKRKVLGLNRYYKVEYRGNIYFIFGRSNDKYCVLIDIFGNKVSFSHLPHGQKTPQLAKCHKISARKSILTQALPLKSV